MLAAGCGGGPSSTGAAPQAPAKPVAAVDAARLTAADTEAGNWMTYGRTYDEQRFSPLKQIDASNVAQLGLTWHYDLDTAHRAQESTPLVIDGVMYVTAAWSKVFALDARTGKQLWAYDPKVPGGVGGTRVLRCRQSWCRGLEGPPLPRDARRTIDRARRGHRQTRLGCADDRSEAPLHDYRRAAHRQRQGHHR